MTRRTIPQIRARLEELADEHGIDELRELAEETKRRSPVRRARSTKPKLTDGQRQELAAYAEEHPDASYMEIAVAHDTTIGRVSEALAGFR